jgi:hypothetical protein
MQLAARPNCACWHLPEQHACRQYPYIVEGVKTSGIKGETIASHWKRGCAVLVATCLLIAAVACSLGVVGVRRGALSPSWFDQNVGTLRVVGYSTWNADCPPYVGCAPTQSESYVVWLMWESTGPSPGTYRLLNLPIAHDL